MANPQLARVRISSSRSTTSFKTDELAGSGSRAASIGAGLQATRDSPILLATWPPARVVSHTKKPRCWATSASRCRPGGDADDHSGLICIRDAKSVHLSQPMRDSAQHQFRWLHYLNLKSASWVLPSLRVTVMIRHLPTYDFRVCQLNCHLPSPRYCSPELPT
jgi:hypothetical protein